MYCNTHIMHYHVLLLSITVIMHSYKTLEIWLEMYVYHIILDTYNDNPDIYSLLWVAMAMLTLAQVSENE